MAAEQKTETIRIRIEPSKKDALAKLFESRGSTISDAVRKYLDDELGTMANPLDVFDSIMASADKKSKAYGAPEPAVEDIVEYVNKAREDRSSATSCA